MVNVNAQKAIRVIDVNWNVQVIDMEWIVRNHVVAKMAENVIIYQVNVHAPPASLAHYALIFVQMEHMAKIVNQSVNVKTMVRAIHRRENAIVHPGGLVKFVQTDAQQVTTVSRLSQKKIFRWIKRKNPLKSIISNR